MVATMLNENFGTATKSQYEQLVFHLFAQNGAIDLERSDFAIAQDLGCTPSKISGLRYSHFQQLTRLTGNVDSRNGVVNELGRHVKVDLRPSHTNDENTTLYIREKYWRDLFRDKAYEFGVFTDTSFNRERVVVSTESLENYFWYLFADSQSWQLEEWSEKYGPDRSAYKKMIDKARKIAESPEALKAISIAKLVSGLPSA